MDTPLQPAGVTVRNLIARGAVEHDRMRKMIGVNVIGERIHVDRHSALTKKIFPALEIDTVIIEKHPLRRGNPSHPQSHLEPIVQG